MRVGVIGGGYFGKYWGAPSEIRQIETPFGLPADAICSYNFDDRSVCTLQRHGPKHQLSPDEVPWQANAVAMKILGADFVIHVTACGALTEDNNIGDLVLFDQIIDFTKTRPYTLGRSIMPGVTHVAMSEPISRQLAEHISSIFHQAQIDHRFGGTMVTIEGPRFATKAESKMFRQWGATLINMTSAPEVFLLHELALPVVGIALVTDLDNTPNAVEERVSTKLITETIQRFQTRVPKAVKAAVTGFEPGRLTQLRVEPMDISKLDTRE